MHEMTITLDRRLFVLLIAVVGVGLGVAVWFGIDARTESQALRSEREAFHQEVFATRKDLGERIETVNQVVRANKEIQERMDAQLAASVNFQRCAFVQVLGPDISYSNALQKINECIQGAEFPPAYVIPPDEPTANGPPTLVAPIPPKTQVTPKPRPKPTPSPTPKASAKPTPEPEQVCIGQTGVCIPNPLGGLIPVGLVTGGMIWRRKRKT